MRNWLRANTGSSARSRAHRGVGGMRAAARNARGPALLKTAAQAWSRLGDSPPDLLITKGQHGAAYRPYLRLRPPSTLSRCPKHLCSPSFRSMNDSTRGRHISSGAWSSSRGPRRCQGLIRDVFVDESPPQQLPAGGHRAATHVTLNTTLGRLRASPVSPTSTYDRTRIR